MRYISIVFILLMFISGKSYGQSTPSYRIFTSTGKEVSFDKMIKSAVTADVILFGELHNDSICHRLELQVLKELYARHPNLTLGMEMFEADDQLVVQEYVSGVIEERHLLYEAKIWDNYETDYKPLVEFAKSNNLTVVATNIPRRYANLVYRKGLSSLDSLSAQAKQYLAPIPIQVNLELPGYKNLNTTAHHHSGGSPENFALAQAIKDATMAYFISKSKTSSNKILHVNGAYHSQNREGIVWYLQKENSALTTSTIHTVEQDSLEKLKVEHLSKADFIICIPANMTKTY